MESIPAATRVFAVPELLEAILTQVGLESAEQPEGYLQTPAIRLFVLQRVDRNFHSVIAGSPSLQRLMCLTSNLFKDEDRLKAIAWLLRKRSWGVSVESSDHEGLALLAHIQNPARANRHYDFRHMATGYATWRKMKVPPLVIHCSNRGYPFLTRYDIRVENEATLGQVYMAFLSRL